MIDSYLTISKSMNHKITRKKSRFIALLSPAVSEEDVDQQLQAVRKSYHDASHHCSAFRLLIQDVVVEASSDDGEPSGSAGVPILQQLASREVCNILAVVVRYYGGTNLGVGGLVRAYSDVVAEALEHIEIETRRIMARIAIRFPVEVNSSVMSTVHRHKAQIESLQYAEAARLDVTLPPSKVASFRAALTEATGARATLEVTL